MKATFSALLLAAQLGLLPACADAQSGSDLPYVASTRGEVFYWVGCDSWRSLSPQNLRWFATEAEARSAGYRASRARGCSAPDSAGPELGPAATGVCTVERIVDGDTLVCQEGDERVRLLMIDAPELDQGEFGEQARGALQRILPPGTSAGVELDIQERDRYRRLLAYLYTPSGEMVNEILVGEGFALPLVIAPNVRYAERIRSRADQAQRLGAGLWGVSAFECTPSDHRARLCE